MNTAEDEAINKIQIGEGTSHKTLTMSSTQWELSSKVLVQLFGSRVNFTVALDS